jgi:hypothetical protein
MSYLPNISSSAILDAQLSRRGRQILTSNNEIFKVAKFALSDSEINYNLINENAAFDDPLLDMDIINLPISEPDTNGNDMIHLIFRNQTFINNQFTTSLTSQSVGQYIDILSSVGDKVLLDSSDTTTKVFVSCSTFNQIDRPYISEHYRIKFTDEIDCYSIDFVSPPLTDSVNNHYTQLSNTEFIFNQLSADATDKYERTTTGAPSLVFTVRFFETNKFFELVQKPENRSSIVIPNFVTIEAVDSARTVLTDIRSATMALEIKNII